MKNQELKSSFLFVVIFLLLVGCTSKHNRLNEGKETDNVKKKTTERFDVNFFLENSGSMNGYMNGPTTTFKNQLYSLLTRFKLLENTNSLNLFLINKGQKELFLNAGNDDLEKFKNILQPTMFKKLAGEKDLGETDINDLIKRCIEKSDNKNISILVSDCIYSPGKSVSDATTYLADQRNGIFLNVASELQKKQLSIIVLSCLADFKGVYYDRYNNKVPFNSAVTRPYYIWIIGGQPQINTIVESKLLERIDGGYSNKIIFQCIEKNQQPDIQILPNSGAGKFKLKRGENSLINEAAKSDKKFDNGLFGFAIRADFSKIIQDRSFFLDTVNYKISGGNFHIVKIEEVHDQPPYSHILKFETDNLIDDSVKIELISKIPSWVSSNSSTDDSKIGVDQNEIRKTFGLFDLMKGVQNAFDQKNKEGNISTIKLKVVKQHSHVNSGFIIVLLIIIVFATIFFIIKKSR
jgi:hypothetical protein